MHIAFAIVFFLFIGLSQTLRQGIFGLNPSETTGITLGALAFCALFILRADIVSTLRPARQDLYGDARLNWTWTRTVRGLFLGPVLWIIPLAYGLALMQINILPVSSGALFGVLLVQVLLVALVQELFFREAALKAFGTSIGAVYLISGLAFFIYTIPQGIPAAMIAVGAGFYFLTLRLVGTNILVVALVHGVTVIMFTQILSLGLSGRGEWIYAGYFLGGASLLSLAVYRLFGRERSVYVYA